ncbi:GGDEF domain-containing protein [Loigolactobacillus jiayinensis]|uniref:GGDEF domain-containing protein n=1 Tax=Loigolactobacillus jiayinensis TaxID=2486016 RepID=A0ABW1R9A6_9LACO|nr:GGDEF domain-containing protein [Loigolactobacillus jiayinensis]
MDTDSILVQALLWNSQLLVAVFFIAGFVGFHLEIWSRGFQDQNISHKKQLLYRGLGIALVIICAVVLNAAGYISSINAVLYHNMGLFILILALLDEDTNIWEYLLRCLMLVAVWSMYYINNFADRRFGISMAILLFMLVIVRYYRKAIGPNFRFRLPIAVIIAADFWFTLPTHPAGMQMSPLIAFSAVLMFFLMKLSTGRQQRRFFDNLQTAHMAHYDELTTTKNFTAYQQDVFTRFGVAHTSQQPLTLALIDVDHFKLVNDRFGHLAGNHVLAKVAQTLKQILQQYGEHYEVYRTGGEEFTLIFPNSTTKEVFQVMAHCWQTIRSTPFVFDQAEIAVTISSGLTQMRSDDQSPDDIYKRADTSLYKSKERGRDTITIDDKTQQLQDDSNQVKYTYFVNGLYTFSDRRRLANELHLRRYDQQQQQWVLPQQHHLDIDTRIELMRTALVNSRSQVLVTTLSVADFLNQKVADKLAAYLNGPDAPDIFGIELSRIPALNLLIPMVDFYHKNKTKVILNQIGSNRYFERINSSMQYFDGVKYTVALGADQMKACKEIKFWGDIAAFHKIGFSIDGITDENLVNWLRKQKVTQYLQGDYFDKPHLPLLTN